MFKEVKRFESRKGIFTIDSCVFDGKLYIFKISSVSENFGDIGERVNGCSYTTIESAEQDLKDLYL
jgi:hypothetical protein